MPGPGFVSPTPGDRPGSYPEEPSFFDELGATFADSVQLGREVATGEQGEATDRSRARESLRGFLESIGVDPDSPATQAVLAGVGEDDQARLEFLTQDPVGQATAAGLVSNPDTQAPFFRSNYGRTLADSGFGRGEVSRPSVDVSERSRAALTARGERGAEVRYNEQTGWTMFANGTLVGPNGEIAFDPSRAAPGSQAYQTQVMSSWTEDEVKSWRSRLADAGYLDPEKRKIRGIDVELQEAFREYQYARYLNGGKAIPRTGDSGNAGRFADRPLFDYGEISHTISNSVYDHLRSLYGVEPDQAEVKRWTQFVIRHGMELQRKYRRDDVSSYAELGKQEAIETFVSRTQKQAAPYHEDLEENTELRDALARAASVAGGLA